MNRRLMLSGLLLLTILLLTVYSTRKAEAGTASPVHDRADFALVAAPYREYGVSDQSQPESQQDAGWITAAWIPYNADVYERGLGSFLANCQYINMVNPVWFLLKEGTKPGTTTISSLSRAFYDQGRIQDCSESELLLIPVIKTVDDSPRLVHAMLDNNPSEHAELLAQIAAGEVNGYPSQGFDGIEIDYEGIDWAHRVAFSEFAPGRDFAGKNRTLCWRWRLRSGLCPHR
jgi:hypothetical protein